jgi:hypothetical protein
VAAVHDILKEVETDNLADIEFKEVCSLFWCFVLKLGHTHLFVCLSGDAWDYY